jgi:hypothetical protein
LHKIYPIKVYTFGSGDVRMIIETVRNKICRRFFSGYHTMADIAAKDRRALAGHLLGGPDRRGIAGGSPLRRAISRCAMMAIRKMVAYPGKREKETLNPWEEHDGRNKIFEGPMPENRLVFRPGDPENGNKVESGQYDPSVRRGGEADLLRGQATPF